MTAASQERPAAPPRRRWLRIAAIAVAAVSLASCRALPPAALIGTAAVSHAIPQADPNGPAFADPAQADAAPFAASPDATSAAAGSPSPRRHRAWRLVRRMASVSM